MSAWPLISDFSRMLQNPKMAFRDPALKDCTVEKSNLGQPKPRSGNFATVYRGYRPDGSEFAIRVFNRGADERRDRYQAVSNYLEWRSVWALVGFNYDEKGIRSASDGKMYPLIIMDWVPGLTLFEWCKEQCRAGDAELVASAADVFLQLVRNLTSNGIVHGDLQHGNILVSKEGHLKLVDYDCMAVPELMGLRNLEIGLAPYQHPARNAETYLFPGLDNYSALMIYTALRALSADTTLWARYVDQLEYDKLLFKQSDFNDPESSALYHDLMNSPDEQVRDLTHYLFQLITYGLYDIPPIDEVLLWCNSVEELLGAHEWDKAVQLVQRMGPNEQIASHLLPLVDLAQRRVAARLALEAALAKGNEEEIRRAYVPQLLDDYPAAAPLVEQARGALQIGAVLEQLRAARAAQQWDVFQELWNTHQVTLGQRESAKPYRDEMTRLITVDSLRKLLADRKAEDQSVIDAWNHLQSLGGHPLAEPWKGEIGGRITRNNSLQNLRKVVQQAPRVPTYEHDKQLAAAWSNSLFEGWDRAANLKQHCELAQTRLNSLAQFIKNANKCSLEIEREIGALEKLLPPTYHPLLAPRIEQARQRMTAYHQMIKSLQEPRLDVPIAAAWKAIKAVGAQPLLPEEVKARVHLAIQRAQLVRALQKLSGLPVAEYDQKLLETWNEALLSNCRDVASFVPQYEQALERKRLLAKIDEALAASDIKTVDNLAALPVLADYPLPQAVVEARTELRTRLEQTRAAKRQTVLNALLENNRVVFFDVFDRSIVSELATQFPHHLQTLSRWIESEIVPLPRCGLGPDPNGSLMEVEPLRYRIRWTWPPGHISERCRLAICAERPKKFAHPDDVTGLHAETIGRAHYESGEGGTVVEIKPEWNGAVVLVWALIELDFQTFYTEPVELAQIELATGPKPKRWGLFG